MVMPSWLDMLIWLLAFDALASLVMYLVSPWFREQVEILGHLLRELFWR